MIEVHRLTKVFGLRVALDRVSLSVPAGALLALFGPNGSGKTTLLRCLATLTRPTAGTARIGGHDVVRERLAVRRLVGLVGHGTQLYDDLTAQENLAFARALAGEAPDPAALRAALARVGLEGVADVRVRALSSGMQRRLALARVMLQAPRVLLLDEAFGGLDQESAKRLEDYLHAFKAEGGSGVLVTHNLARGLAVADRVAFLAGGRIVAEQPREGLTLEALQRLSLTAAEPA